MLCMPLIPFLCLACSELHLMRLHTHLQMPCYSHLVFLQQLEQIMKMAVSAN